MHAALVKADNVDKTLHMSIAFGRVSSQQFWEAIREQLQVINAAMTVISCSYTFRHACDHVHQGAARPMRNASSHTHLGLMRQAPMAKAGADSELQQFAKTFDGVKFRKGETCCLFVLCLSQS